MAFSALDLAPSGRRFLVDSTIFIYHFSGHSDSCTRFLGRCERGEIEASTSVVVLAEVCHRLMLAEAVSCGVAPAGGALRRLRELPDRACALKLHQEQVERIPLMGIRILPIDLRIWLESANLRSRCGLLTNDSLVAASALGNGIDHLASADRDFERVKELQTYGPDDLTL